MPFMINKNINANYCLTKTSANNQNMLSYSLKHTFQNSFCSIKRNCTNTHEIENIIMFLTSSNYFGCYEVPTKILKLCFHCISSLLNYICDRTLFTGIFLDRLKYAIIKPLRKEIKMIHPTTDQYNF